MKTIFTIFIFVVSTHCFAQNQILDTPLKTLDGDVTSLNTIVKNNSLVIVSLWATWCVPCKNELDAINDVYEDWKAETKVELVAVSVDDARTVNRVRPLVNGKSWDYTILLDTNNDLKRALNTTTVPYTLILKNGEIVYRHTGYTPGAEDALYKELKKHL